MALSINLFQKRYSKLVKEQICHQNRSKNDVKIIFRDIFLTAIFEILLIPEVISKKPVKSGLINEISIFKVLNKGVRIVDNIFNIPLDFKIEIMLANTTIKPPIRRIVEILEVILFDKISPKFDKETVLLKIFLLDLEKLL